MLSKVLAIIETHKTFNNPILADSFLDKDLGIDSLGLLFIVADLEDNFKVKIDDTEINFTNFSTPKSILNLIEKSHGKYIGDF